MRKLFIMSAIFALCSTLCLSASPPVRDVGHGIVVDDGYQFTNPSTDLISLFALPAYEYFGTFVVNTLPAIAPVTAFENANLLKSFEPVVADNPVNYQERLHSLLKFEKSDFRKTEKLFLVNCSIRQCLDPRGA